jgi:hypothetical protein
VAKPRPRTPARITLDDLIVQAVQQALAPFDTMLTEMESELAALGREWRPHLERWARHPWVAWQPLYFTRDLGPEIAALTERLAGVETRITAWRRDVGNMSPRMAWRAGPKFFRQAVGLRHEPVTLLLALHKLRDAVADAERVVASYGPITPSPRKVAMAINPEMLRPKQHTASRVEFDPFHVEGGAR